MSRLIEKLLDAGDVEAVINAFSEEEKVWYKSFTEQQRKDFEEAIPKLLKVTDLPGRIMLSPTFYDPTSIMSAQWVLDFVVGLKPSSRGILHMVTVVINQTKIFHTERRLWKNYQSVIQRIRSTAVEF